jgi:protease-4
MTVNLPMEIVRQAGGNLARAARRVLDWTNLPRRDRFWLDVHLRGPLEEMPTLHSPFARTPGANLLEVLETLAAAAGDPQVEGVLLRISGPLRGMSRVSSLRRGIAELRERGTPVVVYAETLEVEGLLAASAANEIWMPESGSVFVVGLRLESFYLREVLGRFDVVPEVVSIGKYKSAGESFTRDGMSSESREQLEALADDLYHELVEGVAAGRNLTPEAVRGIIDAGPYRAPAAAEAGLLDRCLYPDEIDAALTSLRPERAESRSEPEPIRRVEAPIYYALRAADPGWRPLLSGLPRIAYVVARGSIARGVGHRGISSEGTIELLEALRDDARVAGVVLRIESGGGDALASDLLWREVTVVARDKPIVVSMGDVVASGGYFVASAADEVLAEAGTVTGSIGVVGGKVNLEGLYRRIGVAKDAVERGARAGMLSEGRGFTSDEKRAVRSEMTAVYENFVSRVAEGRNLSVEETHAVAQGRVWSGARAEKVGLVDAIGGPLEALQAVRRRAGLSSDQAVIVDRYPRRPRLPSLRDLVRLLPLR